MRNLKLAIVFMMLINNAVTTNCRAAFMVKSNPVATRQIETNAGTALAEHTGSLQNSFYSLRHSDRGFKRSNRGYHGHDHESNLSTISFLLALVGIATFFFAFAVGAASAPAEILFLALTPICGALAALLGAFGLRDKRNSGLAVAGMVIGIIELAFGGVACLFALAASGL